MSEQFLAYAEKNCYRNVKITRFKNHDRVYANTTERSGYPNLETIIVYLRHHIEDVPPEHYSNILWSLEDRALASSHRLLGYEPFEPENTQSVVK